MKVSIKCPDCGKAFTIDHKAADREIERLKAEISRIQARDTASRWMNQTKGDPLSDLMKGMGIS